MTTEIYILCVISIICFISVIHCRPKYLAFAIRCHSLPIPVNKKGNMPEISHLNASLTVEAAILFTILIPVMTILLSIVRVIYIFICMQSSLGFIALELQSNGTLVQCAMEAVSGGENEISLKLKDGIKKLTDNEYMIGLYDEKCKDVKKYTGNKTFKALVSGLFKERADPILDDVKVKFDESSYDIDSGEFKIVAEYSLDYPLFSDTDHVMKHRLEYKGKVFYIRLYEWQKKTGKQDDKKNNEETVMVYITKNGAVYHRDRNCTYISERMKETDVAIIGKFRSRDGSKYYPCEQCIKGEISGRIYYSDYGNRYHRSLECQSIKRYVEAIPLTKIGSRKECKKCGNS